MRNLEVDLKEHSEFEIKEILWKLCYIPTETLLELDLKKEDPTLVKSSILNSCHENGLLEKFANAESYIDTLGVSLGIKDPVVRDIIIEKCYSLILKGNENVEKAIKLFRTDNDGTEYAEKRLIGGLKALGFSNDEANYLFVTCNLYPLSLLIERLSKKRISEIKEVKKGFVKKEISFYKTQSFPKTEEKVEKNTSTDLSVLVANKDTIEKIYACREQFASKTEITEHLNNAIKEVERLQKLMSYITELEVKGIGFEILLEKEEKLKELFVVMDALSH